MGLASQDEVATGKVLPDERVNDPQGTVHSASLDGNADGGLTLIVVLLAICAVCAALDVVFYFLVTTVVAIILGVVAHVKNQYNRSHTVWVFRVALIYLVICVVMLVILLVGTVLTIILSYVGVGIAIGVVMFVVVLIFQVIFKITALILCILCCLAIYRLKTTGRHIVDGTGVAVPVMVHSADETV